MLFAVRDVAKLGSCRTRIGEKPLLEFGIDPGTRHQPGAVARPDFVLVGIDQCIERGRIDETLLDKQGFERHHPQGRVRWQLLMVMVHPFLHVERRDARTLCFIGHWVSVPVSAKRRKKMAGIKMGVVGCGGRMGRMLVAEIAHTEGCSVAGGSEAPGSGYVNQDIGELAGIGRIGIPIGETVEKVIRDSDVVLEFTSPEATAEHAELAASLGTAMVIGTTGLGTQQGDRVRHAARQIPIVWAPNMSLGVNVLLSVVEEVARRLGPEWDVEIMEMHHRGKIDAPSGTALALGRAAAAGRGVELEDVEQRARDGITGPRRTGDIGFAALRGGDAVGDHHVIFAGAAERLELIHRATSRAIYAKGAIRAARWVVGRPPGVYGLKEVLGL